MQEKQHSAPLALLELARARGTLRGILTNRKDPGNSVKRAGKQHPAPHASLAFTRMRKALHDILGSLWIPRNASNVQENSTQCHAAFCIVSVPGTRTAAGNAAGYCEKHEGPGNSVECAWKQRSGWHAPLELTRARGAPHGIVQYPENTEKCVNRAGKQHPAPHAYLECTWMRKALDEILGKPKGSRERLKRA